MPIVIDLIEEPYLNYFVGKTMISKNNPDHLPIYKCEDLFGGMEDRLQILCEALLRKGFTQEAKGVWQRNRLDGVNFDFESF